MNSVGGARDCINPFLLCKLLITGDFVNPPRTRRERRRYDAGTSRKWPWGLLTPGPNHQMEGEFRLRWQGRAIPEHVVDHDDDIENVQE